MNNKLEFKITSDKNGVPLRLDDMSLSAAKAFLILYESLVKIVNLTNGGENTKISITQSSLATSIEGDVVSQIKDELKSVAKSECVNSEIVKQWKNIQEVIKGNGFSYDAIDHLDGTSESIVYLFKDSKSFHKKVSRKSYNSYIKFYIGKLMAVGGKKPNIHIDFGGNKIVVECTEQNADLAKEFLYKNINISVWSKKAVGQKTTYQLCDVYSSYNQFMDFKDFFDRINEMDELSALSNIHDKIQGYLESGNFEYLQRLALIWMHETTDIPTLKTILVITKDFKKHPDFETYRNKLLKIYETKMIPHLKQKNTINDKQKNNR